MRKIIFFELPSKFCEVWHATLGILHVLGGILFVFLLSLHDTHTVATAIFNTLAVVVFGTLCFLIFPLACIAMSAITRFVPFIFVPVYLLFAIGNLAGDHNDISVRIFLLSILGTLWGWFNIRTGVIANRNENFNPIILIEG